GAPIGFALVGKPDLAAALDGDIELKRIYSLSRFHGSGLGAALMQRALEAAQGHRRLLLGVYAQNERALAFYRKQGFADLGTRQFNVGGKLYDDLVLARPLAA
ncbi:MAG TPA: GNAT family N-acetyltransferase, partial [Sphingopyxis sp.]|nr:GNAT family N-acetyltransferase [Sphingopyxis sp.]